MSISISRNRYIGDSDLPAQARTPRAMGTPEWGPLASSHGNWLHEAGRAVNLAGRACAGERLSRGPSGAKGSFQKLKFSKKVNKEHDSVDFFFSCRPLFSGR